MSDPDEVRMTFGEHLEELRARLIRGLLAFGAAAIVALVFQTELFAFFLQPYRDAQQSMVERGELRRPYAERKLDAVLERLRQQGRWGEPDDLAVREAVGEPPLDPISAIGVTETFMVHIKVALLAAALLSAPVLLYQLWLFIAAGLYERERRTVMRVFPFSFGMFGLGMLFGFLVLVPVSLDFLLSYGDASLVSPAVTVSSYTSLLFVLLFVMGLVFQVPLVMTVVCGMGMIPVKTFRTHRRLFILGAVVLAAILTPPDYMTQLLVAGPMVLLYEVGIWLAVLAEWRKRRRAAEEGAER